LQKLLSLALLLAQLLLIGVCQTAKISLFMFLVQLVSLSDQIINFTTLAYVLQVMHDLTIVTFF
jgi:hypothetical protein